MLAWFRSVFGALLDALFDGLSWFIDNVIGTIIDWCMDLAQWAVDLMPDWVGDLNVHSKVEEIWALDSVAFWFYLFPISECFAIFTLTATIIATIRGIRFIVGWIPTIEG
ncbi:MAG: hypothetical protein ACFCBV_07320 [Phycisphaerales bacterium]